MAFSVLLSRKSDAQNSLFRHDGKILVSLSMADASVTIIGAGVVGLAIAARLSERKTNIYVLEKNERYGLEASSRNSEVIHAGIYYPPGSLKATLCVEGNRRLYELCEKFDVPHRRTTKMIVATNRDEEEALERIYQNGRANGVALELLTAERAKSLEPEVDATSAIFSPSSGILSAHGLMDFFYHRARENGVIFQFRCEVIGLDKGPDGFTLRIREKQGESSFTSEAVVNAAGLESDTVASMAGIDVDRARYRLHYCKGNYFSVQGARQRLVSRLVYPIPHREGLGIHTVVDLGGRLRLGPDAEYLPGRTLDYGVDEAKRPEFARAVQKLLPAIEEGDLEPDMSGIRAKLQAKGEPPRDFVIAHEKERGLEGLVNLVGFDSPGLTCSPAVARYVDQLMP